MKKIYLIGIDHSKNQFTNGTEAHILEANLKDIIDTYNITVVAEENSTMVEAVRNYMSVGHDFAKKSGRMYVFLDPDLDERKKLGIKGREQIAKELGIPFPTSTNPPIEALINKQMRPYDKMREAEWLKRMEPYLTESICVICGHEHLSTFSELLTLRGIDTEVLKIFK